MREQRIYTPAGDNAMEYYIALRKKTEKPDPSAESALMDLQPYAVIAAEQAIGRGLPGSGAPARTDRRRRPAGAVAGAHRRGHRQGQGRRRAGSRRRRNPDRRRSRRRGGCAPEGDRGCQGCRRSQPGRRRCRRRPSAAGSRRRHPGGAAAGAGHDPPGTGCAVPPRADAGRPAPVAPGFRRRSRRREHPQPAYPACGPARRHQGFGGGFLHRQSRRQRGDINIVSAKPRGVFERNVQAAVKRWRHQPIAGAQQVTRTFDFE